MDAVADGGSRLSENTIINRRITIIAQTIGDQFIARYLRDLMSSYIPIPTAIKAIMAGDSGGRRNGPEFAGKSENALTIITWLNSPV